MNPTFLLISSCLLLKKNRKKIVSDIVTGSKASNYFTFCHKTRFLFVFLDYYCLVYTVIYLSHNALFRKQMIIFLYKIAHSMPSLWSLYFCFDFFLNRFFFLFFFEFLNSLAKVDATKMITRVVALFTQNWAKIEQTILLSAVYIQWSN